MTFSRTDQDSPWEEILRLYFPEAIAFFFPNTAIQIDWTRPWEFLDKEFQQITLEAELCRTDVSLSPSYFRSLSSPSL